LETGLWLDAGDNWDITSFFYSGDIRRFNVNIYQSITKAMSEIEPIAKAQKNTMQGFMFRGIDAIMNELQPVFIRNKIFIVPEVIDMKREDKVTAKGGSLVYAVLTIKFNFIAEDGSSVSAIVIGEAMDSGDKASNKALSVGFKYACLQVFCIPTEDTKDPDFESHEPVHIQTKHTPSKTMQEIAELVKAVDENNIPLYNEAEKAGWRKMVAEKGEDFTLAELKRKTK